MNRIAAIVSFRLFLPFRPRLVSVVGLFCLFFPLTYSSMHAQSTTADKPLRVGIVVYPGVEILDFSGPSEVFAATKGFEPFVVAFKKEPILSQGFVSVMPQYSIDDCPPTDILVFPGGGTSSVMNEPRFIEWVKARSQSTQFMMSVCTGAGILSKAGLLDQLEATTYHGYIDELQKITPTAKVHADTRFVDNGHVITTAGVSAGIDGALYVVSRIKGEAVAKATAYYMEYDKWQPREGKVIETPFIRSVRASGIVVALDKHKSSGSIQPLYYPGELINLASEMMSTDIDQSEAILLHLLRTTTPSVELCDHLTSVWHQQGKNKISDSETFMEKLSAGDIAWAKQAYTDANKLYPGWQFFHEGQLNNAGYQLFFNGKGKEGLEVLQWGTELYPRSANLWDSVAEVAEEMGEYEIAIAASQKCIATLPSSGYAPSYMAQLKDISQKRVERLESKQ